jgi:hypothetical protein
LKQVKSLFYKEIIQYLKYKSQYHNIACFGKYHIFQFTTVLPTGMQSVPITTNIVSSNPQGLKNFPKGHWFRTNEHQELICPENFSTGPEYRNEGNKIC